ncbi:hypothetical protein GWI33_010214 [Rhynchophorus ferrugineus]|uniref:Uncharacterized protein n=1 Tax=Rhynchophorus ferrugineus TaxID=354439 RepID=A0A834MAB5_RHYFE|nr:hypothetical protein GWI33_010214 [Rhynchophorus ferrugineus]
MACAYSGPGTKGSGLLSVEAVVETSEEVVRGGTNGPPRQDDEGLSIFANPRKINGTELGFFQVVPSKSLLLMSSRNSFVTRSDIFPINQPNL